jgi:hypothetical protein
MARYLLNGRLLAAASLGRDQELLEVAAYLEKKMPDHSPP